MNRAEFLMNQASSECMEVGHRFTKAMHFGLNEVQPGQGLTNAQRAVGEYVDLLAVIEMLEEGKLIEVPVGLELRAMIDAKKAKVEHFYRYARDTCGTVTE